MIEWTASADGNVDFVLAEGPPTLTLSAVESCDATARESCARLGESVAVPVLTGDTLTFIVDSDTGRGARFVIRVDAF